MHSVETTGVFVVFQKVEVRKKREAPAAEAGEPPRRTLRRRRSTKEGESPFFFSLFPETPSVSVRARAAVAAAPRTRAHVPVQPRSFGRYGCRPGGPQQPGASGLATGLPREGAGPSWTASVRERPACCPAPSLSLCPAPPGTRPCVLMVQAKPLFSS